MRNICNLKSGEIYGLGEIRKRIEIWCDSNKCECPNLDNGNINEIVRWYGVKPCATNGITGLGYREFYKGSDLIPFLKTFTNECKIGRTDAFIKSLKNASKNTPSKQVTFEEVETTLGKVRIPVVPVEETPKRTITFADATQLYMDAHDFASALSRFSTTLLKVLEG